MHNHFHSHKSYGLCKCQYYLWRWLFELFWRLNLLSLDDQRRFVLDDGAFVMYASQGRLFVRRFRYFFPVKSEG